MTDDEKQLDNEADESTLNKQMSPFAGGVLFGGLTLAFILYRSLDFLRALLVGSAVFALLFWVMWVGQYLERRTKENQKNE